MLFRAEPNLYVRISNKYLQRVTGKKGLAFDQSGYYETDSELLIKLLSQHFETVENNVPGEEIKVHKCKKCDFATDNMGELMAHHKKNHPKEGK